MHAVFGQRFIGSSGHVLGSLFGVACSRTDASVPNGTLLHEPLNLKQALVGNEGPKTTKQRGEGRGDRGDLVQPTHGDGGLADMPLGACLTRPDL